MSGLHTPTEPTPSGATHEHTEPRPEAAHRPDASFPYSPTKIQLFFVTAITPSAEQNFPIPHAQHQTRIDTGMPHIRHFTFYRQFFS